MRVSSHTICCGQKKNRKLNPDDHQRSVREEVKSVLRQGELRAKRGRRGRGAVNLSGLSQIKQRSLCVGPPNHWDHSGVTKSVTTYPTGNGPPSLPPAITANDVVWFNLLSDIRSDCRDANITLYSVDRKQGPSEITISLLFATIALSQCYNGGGEWGVVHITTIASITTTSNS
ncbi:hypothetical protein J6590_087401 [Homalodisca vitripennis]|nr:hypothetical protein J6590_087401 [Homalodisca vitripennis]